MKAKWTTMIGLAFVIGIASAVVAEEGTTARPRRPALGGERPQAGDRTTPGGERMAPGGDRGGPGPGERRLEALQELMNTAEGKAEVTRFREQMDKVHAEGKAVHDAIRADIQNGKTPREALAAHQADLKAQARKIILAAIEHREKMIAIAKQHVDQLTDKVTERLEQRLKDAGQRPRPRTPRPEPPQNEE